MKEELQQLRDLMFFYGCAVISDSDQKKFDEIWRRASATSPSITRRVFPDVEVFDGDVADECIAIIGHRPDGSRNLVMLLSEYWFDTVDAALAEL